MAKYINLVQKTSNDNYEEIYIKQNLPREFVFNLSTSWTESQSGEYIQTVTVNGITTDTTGIIGIATTASDVERSAAILAQLYLSSVGQNSITVIARGVKPTIVIPCVIVCSSNMKKLRSNGSSTENVVGN